MRWGPVINPQGAPIIPKGAVISLRRDQRLIGVCCDQSNLSLWWGIRSEIFFFLNLGRRDLDAGTVLKIKVLLVQLFIYFFFKIKFSSYQGMVNI